MQKNHIVSRQKSSRRLPLFAPFLAALASSCFGHAVHAQTAPAPSASRELPDAPSPQPSSQDDVTIRNLPRNFLHDQAAIWTSPVDLRAHDLKWLAPARRRHRRRPRHRSLRHDAGRFTRIPASTRPISTLPTQWSTALVAAPVAVVRFWPLQAGRRADTPRSRHPHCRGHGRRLWLWSRA